MILIATLSLQQLYIREQWYPIAELHDLIVLEITSAYYKRSTPQSLRRMIVSRKMSGISVEREARNAVKSDSDGL